MTRIWILSAAVVAVVVAAVALFTAGSGTHESAVEGPPLPPPLTESEVRTYIEVQGRLHDLLGHAAQAYEAGRTSEGLLEERNAILREHHLTPGDWTALSRRVETVVNAIRYKDHADEIQARLKDKVAALSARKKNAKGAEQKVLSRQIERLEAQIKAGPPKVRPQDEALAKQYWTDLDRLAPHLR